MRIVGISDVSLGYSSPQIPALMTSVVDYYGAEGIMLEPDQPERPPRHQLFPHLKLLRINTAFHPHSLPGRIEYMRSAAQAIDALCPDMLVIYCTFSLPVLFKIRRRPDFVIYYSVESIPSYGSFDMEMNHHIAPLIDLVIFPEENRAARETTRFEFKDTPKVILYNCVNPKTAIRGMLPSTQRNARLIYSGTIDRKQTFGDYFLDAKMKTVPLDIYGLIKASSENDLESYLSQLDGAVRYCGYVDAEELSRIRKAYSYSLVMWNPVNENQLFAAPNKFFESIADGVPPIAAPHPQCKLLIRRYRCGLLMENWSFAAYDEAIQRALHLYGTPAYSELVHNCARAVEAELNWETQFEKLKPHLKR